METVEVVIRIPEEQYRTLNAKSQNDVVVAIDSALLIEAIKDGTPLPKGHGRLIDADAVTKSLQVFKESFVFNIVNGVSTGVACLAPTIIEAYKEVDDGN